MISTDSRPATKHVSITKSDATDLTAIGIRAVFIGGAGDIAIQDVEGTDITYTVPAGVILPISPAKVLATGTDATNIVGLL